VPLRGIQAGVEHGLPKFLQEFSKAMREICQAGYLNYLELAAVRGATIEPRPRGE
jgi:hypothetical protein